MGRNPLMMIQDLGGPPLCGQRTISKRFVIIYRKIVKLQLDFWLRWWASVSLAVMLFYTRIWGKWKLNARLAPCTPSDDQKEACSSTCSDLWETAAENPEFCSGTIAGDETWHLQYDLQTKWQNVEWKGSHSPSTKKACAQPSTTKPMLKAFSNWKGADCKEFIVIGQMINEDFCK